MEPQIRYARTVDGVNIAYFTMGEVKRASYARSARKQTRSESAAQDQT